jgi:hypothetical protein
LKLSVLPKMRERGLRLKQRLRDKGLKQRKLLRRKD